MKPVWDKARRELWFGGALVLKFDRLAPCQMQILEEFQREGWRVRIDDPLAPRLRGNAKERLHNAINALNRGRLVPTIHFRIDARCAGIEWERV